MTNSGSNNNSVDGLESNKTEQAPKAKQPSWEERFVQAHSPGNTAPKDSSIPQAFWHDVQIVADNVLQKVDASGSVSKGDLGKAIQSGKLKGDEAQVAAALYNNFDRVKTSSDFLSMTPKIGKEDIATLTAKGIRGEQAFNKVDDLTYWADNQGNLKKYSSGNSGGMSYDDISAAQKRSDLAPQDRSMLSELSANYFSIANNGKIGKTEIDNYYNNFLKSNKDFSLSDAVQRDMQYVEKNQINPNANKLFGDQNNAIASVKADAVLQGFAGDCAFKAALAGLANARPQDVVAMLRPTESGQIDVKLPGVKDKTIAVSPPTDEELGLFANRNKPVQDGYWPTVITKAFGAEEKSHTGIVNGYMNGDKTLDEWAGLDGDQAHAMEALTGHEVFSASVLDMTDKDMGQRLMQSQSDHRVMVLTTATGSDTTADGFKKEHAFTITKVSNNNGEIAVTVRDPRAIGGDNRPDGTMTVSLATLKRNFAKLYLESNKPL